MTKDLWHNVITVGLWNIQNNSYNSLSYIPEPQDDKIDMITVQI